MANNLETPFPRIAVAAPTLNGNEKRYVLECLETTWISSIGRFITEFERAFARFCGVEHAAEAHGAEYKGRRVGGLGNCAAFSFFGNKIMTTGEGGMVTTNDGDLAEKLRLYRGQGLAQGRRYWHSVVGYNYRMTNVAAAIGLAQLEQIDELMGARARLAGWYRSKLERLANKLVPQAAEPWTRPVLWMQT